MDPSGTEVMAMPTENYVYPEGNPERDEARYINQMTDTVANKLMRVMADEAKAIVTGDRQRAYGEPAENHGCTAAIWTAYLSRKLGMRVNITAEDVCLMNAGQKMSRHANTPKRDNLVDIVGYALNAAACDVPPLANGT
jgi:hypothetical protein